MAVDFKSLGKFQQGAIVTGALAFVFTFFGAYRSASGYGRSGNLSNAWDGVGTLACLLLIAVLALIVVRAFNLATLPDTAPWSLVALAGAALATLIFLIKPFVLDTGGADGISGSPGWSGWVLIVLMIAFTACTALMFKESGEKLPQVNKNNGGTTPPPPPAA